MVVFLVSLVVVYLLGYYITYLWASEDEGASSGLSLILGILWPLTLILSPLYFLYDLSKGPKKD